MNYSIRAIVTVLLFALLPLSVQAYDFEACYECHEEALNGDSARPFVHSPYRQQQCAECHAAQVPESAPKAAPAKALSAAMRSQRKINWLADSAMADTNHGFLLPGDKLRNTLVVEWHGIDGEFSRHETAIPSLSYLTEVEDSGKPPTISNVQVLKVKRGVFLSVTIGWQTNTLTDALVRYGIQDLSQTSKISKRLGWQHQVVLYNLEPDRTYRFTAVSNDLFGRSQVSEPLTFSTSEPLTVTQPDNPGNLPETRDEAVITSSFQRFGTDYLLELRLEQPASVYIGSREAAREQFFANGSPGAMGGGMNEFHAGLSSEVVISLQACRSCHQTYFAASHPVNVYPKPGMTIPPEYPTLPDGRITCRSCHASHSSDYISLVRKQSRRELCVGCHQDML